MIPGEGHGRFTSVGIAPDAKGIRPAPRRSSISRRRSSRTTRPRH